jgi:hypothetical protein|tara:strand:+ start:1445 stop:1741 length:297 start_codon:yes stop_codon:yes gene_type:complete
MITLSIFLAISFLLNILLIWYLRRLASQFTFFNENVIVLEEKLTTFDQHLNSVYELEMFYGDDTLESLIKHSKQLLLDVQEFYDNFSLDQEEEEDDGS